MLLFNVIVLHSSIGVVQKCKLAKQPANMVLDSVEPLCQLLAPPCYVRYQYSCNAESKRDFTIVYTASSTLCVLYIAMAICVLCY